MTQVVLLDKMGSDLSVVNSARVSFSKVHTKFQDNDEKLIKYLAHTIIGHHLVIALYSFALKHLCL